MKSEVKSAVKHTAGPWTLEKREKGCKYWQIGNSVEVPIFSVLCERKEAIANARLIAAAPELLEACKELLGRLSQAIENHPNLSDPNDSSEESHEWTEGDRIALDNAKNAIANATGETL